MEASGITKSLQRVRRVYSKYPVLSAGILAVIVLVALIGPLITPHNPVIGELDDRHLGPFSNSVDGKTYLLGADHAGRDVLSRVLVGTRNSVWIMAVALFAGTAVGVPVALLAGWYRGFIDEAITRVVDIWMAVPFILIALVIIQILGTGKLQVLLLVLAMTAWVSYVRILRAEVLVIRELDYVNAAKISGASGFWIMRKHMLPGVLGRLIVIATISASGLVLAEATLSFLGVGIAPPKPSWGVMIEQSRTYLTVAPHQMLVPGSALILLTAALNYLGDWFRDRLSAQEFVV